MSNSSFPFKLRILNNDYHIKFINKVQIDEKIINFFGISSEDTFESNCLKIMENILDIWVRKIGFRVIDHGYLVDFFKHNNKLLNNCSNEDFSNVFPSNLILFPNEKIRIGQSSALMEDYQCGNNNLLISTSLNKNNKKDALFAGISRAFLRSISMMDSDIFRLDDILGTCIHDLFSNNDMSFLDISELEPKSFQQLNMRLVISTSDYEWGTPVCALCAVKNGTEFYPIQIKTDTKLATAGIIHICNNCKVLIKDQEIELRFVPERGNSNDQAS